MTDIVERLRDDFLRGEITLWNILPEAASEIERLRLELNVERGRADGYREAWQMEIESDR